MIARGFFRGLVLKQNLIFFGETKALSHNQFCYPICAPATIYGLSSHLSLKKTVCPPISGATGYGHMAMAIGHLGVLWPLMNFLSSKVM